MRSEEAVKDLKLYLEKNYSKPIRISKLCAQRYLSEQYVCRRFKEITGSSPKQYLMQLRLNNAARALKETGEPICHIAFSCGFTDINNFCKQFRACFGCTPSSYREGATE